MSNTSDQTTKQNDKTRLIVGEVGIDTETGIVGKGHSYDNGKTFVVDDTIYGRIYHADDHGKIWKGIQDQVAKVVAPAKSAADSAVSAADAAVASAQVTSDAVSAIASATAEAKQGANEAMSRALSAWDVATGAKEAVTDFDPLLKSAQSDASKALTQIADTASALSDAKTEFGSDVAAAKQLANTAQTTANNAVESASENARELASQANALSDTKKAMDSGVASAMGLANTAQTTADSAIKSAASVASDLTAVASQAKSNADGITKVTSDVGLLQTTVADNSGNISKIQETAAKIQQAVSDNAGNITTAKQTADSAIAVASDAKSNATVAVQTASGASLTATNAQSDATTAMVTASGAVTQASDAKSNATIAVQTASEASVTATNAQGDASIAKQTASDASVQIKNAQGDISTLQTRAGKIEASVATNSGAIANVQVTANQLKASVSDNAGNITTAKQTADSAVTVASDARSNATVAIQTASQASITASSASGQAASAVITANGAMTTASNAKSDATVAVQTASGASLTATNAQSDATIAKQTASEATVQASNAESDFAQLSIRANKIEANVANNSGAIASVQQTANGLTTTVADIKANGGGVNLVQNTSSTATVFNSSAIMPNANRVVSIGTWSHNNIKANTTYTMHVTLNFDNVVASKVYWTNFRYQLYAGGDYTNPTFYESPQQGIPTGVTKSVTYAFTFNMTTPPSSKDYSINIRFDNITGGTVSYQGLMIEEGSVAHDWSPAPDDLQAQFTQIKTSIDGVTTTINDPKTGLNATYQTAQGNASTISNVKGDVSQLQTTANGLTSRVGNLESKTDKQQTAIEQNKTAITLKADQTTVNTLKGTVDQNTATLQTQAGQIQAKVSASDVTGMLNGYATQSYAQSLVTQTADKWNLNLTSLKTDVNAIKTTGGGVNLANGTSSKDQSSGDASQTTGWVTPIIATFDNPQAGQQYTISVNVKPNGGSYYMQIWDGTSPTQRVTNVYSGDVSVTQGQKFTATITWPSGSNKYLLVQLVNHNDGGQIVWNSAMIEEGAVAHTWSPAPSDMATVTSVTNLSATVNGIKGTVANKADQSAVTQLSNLIQDKVSSGDFTSTTTQLKNLINQRVQVGDVISQINQEAGGDTLIQVSNGKKSLILDAGNTIFTGKAWIPDAAISEINTDKLFFSDSNGNKSFMSTNLGALDPMAPANSLSIRYKTGYEVTTSDRGVFFMMGQNYTRYAVKSKYSDKFSGIWASDTEAYFIEEGQGLHLWAPDKDQSAWALYNSNNVGIRASLANTNAIDVGKVDNGYDYNTRMDTSPTAIAFYVNGWEWVAGYVEAMGHTTHSTLSSKTRIEQADPDHMLDLINHTELTTFAYTSELADGTDHRHIGPIIDDINDVAQYQIPSEFVAPTKTARDDGNIVGALIGAVQALTKRIKKLEDKLNG